MRNNITRHEFVGMNVVVTGSSDPGIPGMSGVVIDETKSMMILDTPRGEKSIPKKDTMFTFLANHETVRVTGNDITRRPADRVAAKP